MLILYIFGMVATCAGFIYYEFDTRILPELGQPFDFLKPSIEATIDDMYNKFVEYDQFENVVRMILIFFMVIVMSTYFYLAHKYHNYEYN